MTVRHYLQRAMEQPPHVVIYKVLRLLKIRLNAVAQRTRDLYLCTYLKGGLVPGGDLFSYFGGVASDRLMPCAGQLSRLAGFVLKHRFNLLGSDWVEVKHGIRCRGLEGYCYEMGASVSPDLRGSWLEGRINRPNLRESKHVWELIDEGYSPIDWHLDFKSGYRWREDHWSFDIPFFHNKGVDIKVPWELARMQHLPQLAWAYQLASQGEPGFGPPEPYAREFRNQVLDFIATNPPRFGVNWRSTMDVAIRVTNWLVTYDLFRAYGTQFDEEFRTEFIRSVHSHGEHIANHLEWNENLRGNHYLSNVVGLLFVAAYLPCTPETDAWLAFALQELAAEVKTQFNPDGASFEASTGYHRLSAEMVVYATALVLGLPEKKKAVLKEKNHSLSKGQVRLKLVPTPLPSRVGSDGFIPFPDWYMIVLEKMAEFTMRVTKGNGEISQIGDNDSGRFLKLQPSYQPVTVTDGMMNHMSPNSRVDVLDDTTSWDENHLDHHHLVAAVNGLFGREDFASFTGPEWVETDVIRQLAKGMAFPSHVQPNELAAQENDGFDLQAYPDFGLYLYRSKDLYLLIRCGSIGQNGNGGHAHNDNLSFELNVKGYDFIVDGGSYLYTPMPLVRNEFRSTRSHNTVGAEGYEQNRWAEGFQGLFSMKNEAQARMICFTPQHFVGEHTGFDKKHRRQFKWEERCLIIEDTLDADHPWEVNLNLAPQVEVLRLVQNGASEFLLEIGRTGIHLIISLKGFSGVDMREGFFSKGYGQRLKNSLIRCYRSKPRTEIKIDFERGLLRN